MEQEGAGRAGAVTTTKLWALPPAMLTASWCSGERAGMGRRAHRARQEQQLCGGDRGRWLLTPVSILAGWKGQVHPLSLPLCPSCIETCFGGGIRGSLGDTFSLRPELNVVTDSVFH